MRNDLAFVALIATLGLGPLVSSNAQDDICLSSGPLRALRPNHARPLLSGGGNHALSWCAASRLGLAFPSTPRRCAAEPSQCCPAAIRYRDVVSLLVASQRSARGATLAAWQHFHGSSSGSVRGVAALRLVISACRWSVCTPVIGCTVRPPHPRRVIAAREGYGR